MAGQDGTEKQPGATPSAGAPGTLEEPKTFTQEQVEAAERKGRSDALAEIGRVRAESARALTLAEAANRRFEQMLKDQEAQELDAARDDPAQLVAIQERQRRRAAEKVLAERELELGQHKEHLTQMETERTEARRQQAVQQAASRFGVSPGRLAKLAKFSDGSPEAIEDIAKELPKVDEGATGKGPLKPDSGGAIGGAMSREQLIAAYGKDPYNPVVRSRYLELRRAEGR